MAKSKSKGQANAKVATKNALRVKRKAASKRRRVSRKETRRKKVMDAKMKSASSFLRPNTSQEEEEDMDDLIEMTDAEYLPKSVVLSRKESS